MKRYKVPCLAFINKLDRAGANPYRVTEALREKLSHNAVMMQIPMGLEKDHEGVVDLLTMKAQYFDGDQGETVREEDIPAEYTDKATEYRALLLDKLSMLSDELMELMLEEKEVPLELLRKVVRESVIKRELTPVYMGSAYKNKGVPESPRRGTKLSAKS